MFSHHSTPDAVQDNKNVTSSQQNSPPKNVDIYAMPTKFLPSRPKGKGRKGRKLVVLALVLIAILGSVVVGAIWYLNKNLPTQQIANTVAVNNNTNTANTNTNPADSLTNASNDNQTTPGINQVSDDDSVPDDNPPPTEDEVTGDADGDDLTVDEEGLFLTNINKSDTDRDGYSDGQEVISLYNPLVPGQNLESSGLVTRYRNNNFLYSVLLPRSWLPSPANAEASEVVLLSNSETGEFISIQAVVNGDGQSLEVLTPSYFAGDDSPENYSLGDRPALRTKTRVLSVAGNLIYVLDHQINASAPVRFGSVFEMILKSWQISNKNDIEIPS